MRCSSGSSAGSRASYLLRFQGFRNKAFFEKPSLAIYIQHEQLIWEASQKTMLCESLSH